jgi:hypothetical protein
MTGEKAARDVTSSGARAKPVDRLHGTIAHYLRVFGTAAAFAVLALLGPFQTIAAGSATTPTPDPSTSGSPPNAKIASAIAAEAAYLSHVQETVTTENADSLIATTATQIQGFTALVTQYEGADATTRGNLTRRLTSIRPSILLPQGSQRSSRPPRTWQSKVSRYLRCPDLGLQGPSRPRLTVGCRRRYRDF